ncbi:unnamed protein product, partial [Echinostoma caproni]|uniref:MCM domain-containing protein n=1 Tax=Echinostoma caproni TaxID=27848 RepID=A0A183B5F6_9TREM
MRSYYSNTSTRIRIYSEESWAFELGSRVLQGCQLSLMLFNFVVDWIMSYSMEGYQGVQIPPNLWPTDLEFADDIVIFGEDMSNLQVIVGRISLQVSEIGLVFSELLLVRPHDTLCLLDDGLRVALDADRFTGESGSQSTKRSYRHVHVRLTALPVIPEVHRNTIPWSVDVGKFIALRATAKNYQEIRVHERFRCLAVGLMPRSIAVCLEDDLLETVKPGDDVVVNGIVIRRWRAPYDGAPCEITLAIKANYIENLSELKTGMSSNRLSTERIVEFERFWSENSTTWARALEARNQLVRSICPNVCVDGSLGSTELKSRVRGSPHILLIGDPGTAKSVLLRAATDLSSRAVLTAATGTTAAGLTATAVRDSHGWTLDAGALVLADGGLCAIDEFTALHGTHRAAVHEAMEQQTISLAKAGLMARLNCRCSVLAAANPPHLCTGLSGS